MVPISERLTSLNEIAAVATVAIILGLLFMRMRQPPIVGYILAGVVLGPTGLGLVHQTHSVELLAELGVLLLLFLIGMEISIRAFVLVIKPAVLIAAGQIAAALGLTTLFGWLFGWTVQQTLLLGFVIAVSSTAVAIKILEDIDELRTMTGRITVGVMIAQDIAIVPMLIIAEAFGDEAGLGFEVVVRIAFAISLLGLLLWYLGRPGKIRFPGTALINGRPDLVALAALAFCFTASTMSGVLGLSPVYGAFVAGLIVANSTMRVEAIEVTEPIQSVLVFVFFLSIGLLIDLAYIAENWPLVLSFTLAIIVLKTILNIALTRATGQPWKVAFPAGLAMAQIGEFSFILAAVGLQNGVLDLDAYRLALSVIALSIIVSPVWMTAARRVHGHAITHLSEIKTALTELSDDETLAGNTAMPALRAPRVYYRAFRIVLSRRRRR